MHRKTLKSQASKHSFLNSDAMNNCIFFFVFSHNFYSFILYMYYFYN